jgi:hypothetical protein
VLGSGTSGVFTNRAADLELAANGDLWASMGIQQTGRLYHSLDGGDHWTRIGSAQGLPTIGVERIEIACAPSDANRVYVLLAGSDGDCLGIYRTEDAGASWIACDNPGAFDMDNFCRGQAWYDLIACVDPNNPDRLFIGGVDLLVSNDAGRSFRQISQWYGGNGYQYVHADQHAMMFEPGNSNVLYFGNDGGIWRSSNASAMVPTIQDRNLGYNITQYFACAIGPLPNQEELLAGAQDNGTQRYTNLGINQTLRVTGGDGAFCHIDQDEREIQISSYVYNNYWITSNGWSTNQSYFFGDYGRFINPTDYDDRSNILYACGGNGNYLRVSNIGRGTPIEELVNIPLLSGSPTALTVSPHTPHRVFMAAGGRVLRVDRAHQATPQATMISATSGMPNGYVSCIAVSPSSDDHLLITYSNYGLASVWETRDGGGTWRMVEGDLPDMPVRWALFTPRDPNQVLLATELGVWATGDLQADPVRWRPVNQGLANVRTDMLQLRAADEVLVAGTHGRGLYSTRSFSLPSPSFEVAQLSLLEGLAEADCPSWQEVTVSVVIDRAPSEPLSMQVTWSPDSSTMTPSDFTWQGDSLLIFPAGETSPQTITLRFWDDGQAEGPETLHLHLESNSAPQRAYPGKITDLTITLDDAYPDPRRSDSLRTRMVLDEDFEGQQLPEGWSQTQASSGSDGFLLGTSSTLSRGNLVIPPRAGSIVATNDQRCRCDKGNDRLISPTMDFSRVTAATLTFDAYYSASAPSLEAAQVLLSSDGGTTWFPVNLFPFTGWHTYQVNLAIYELTGKANVQVAFRYSDGGGPGRGLAIDRVQVLATEDLQVQAAVALAAASYPVGPQARVDFYTPSGEIMATLDNLSDHDFGCVTVRIDRAGAGTSDFWSARDDRWDLADKTLFLSATNPAIAAAYQLTWYHRPAEVQGWEAATGYDWAQAVRMLRSAQPMANTTPEQPYPSGEAPTQVLPTHAALPGGEDRMVTGTFTGAMGGFGMGNPGTAAIEAADLLAFTATGRPAKVDLTWEIAQEQSVQRYWVQRATEAAPGWTDLDSLPATQIGSYALVDPAPTWGLNRYRLRLRYLDGGTALSEEQSVYFYGSLADWQVLPNPFGETLTVSVPSGFNQEVALTLFDVAGRQAWRGTAQPGAGRLLTVSPQALTPGAYTLRISVAGEAVAQRKVRRQ